MSRPDRINGQGTALLILAGLLGLLIGSVVALLITVMYL